MLIFGQDLLNIVTDCSSSCTKVRGLSLTDLDCVLLLEIVLLELIAIGIMIT
jgi:hypothetical protein